MSGRKLAFLLSIVFVLFPGLVSAISEREGRDRNEVIRMLEDVRANFTILNQMMSDMKRKLEERALETKAFHERVTKVEEELKLLDGRIKEIEDRMGLYAEKERYEKEFENMKERIQFFSRAVKVLAVVSFLSIVLSISSLLSQRSLRRRSRMLRF